MMTDLIKEAVEEEHESDAGRLKKSEELDQKGGASDDAPGGPRDFNSQKHLKPRPKHQNHHQNYQ